MMQNVNMTMLEEAAMLNDEQYVIIELDSPDLHVQMANELLEPFDDDQPHTNLQCLEEMPNNEDTARDGEIAQQLQNDEWSKWVMSDE
jgi:hypothetical protein